MSRPSPMPPQGGQQYRLLQGMLNGDLVTPVTAIVDYNVLIAPARCAELRALGWPVRTSQVPHPNQTKFPGKTMTAYFLDSHFRRWIAENPSIHPADYPFDEGRGKFSRS